MKVLVSGRRTGKTNKCIEIARNSPKPCIIITMHNQEVEFIKSILSENDKEIDVITYGKLQNLRGFHNEPYKTAIIDNLEFLALSLLQNSLPCSAEIYATMTGELIDLKND